MPKVSKASRKKAKVAAAATLVGSLKAAENQSGKDEKVEGKEAMSRGQRKRLAKREQYLRRERMVMSSLKLKTLEEQKGRLDGLDAIKDALTATIVNKNNPNQEQPTPDAESERASSVKTNKAKKSIAQKELTHLNLVLQHPSFQQNPFATMQQHLRNTLVKQAEEQEIIAKEERAKEAKRAEEKKEARKERIRDAKFEKSRKQRRRRN